MDKGNVVEIYSFDSKLRKNGNLKLPLDELKKIAEKGFKEVKIVIYGDPLKGKRGDFDQELFFRIKSLQSLPDSVVFEFLENKGSLTKGDFDKRYFE